jgi:D-tagatose-1,6-bisphosphate aldolase subunit GatZ/KbaZ
MKSIKELVRSVITLRQRGTMMTLLAVCPNSDGVLEAAVKVAAVNHTPMLFAATLNQVDRDGGYTGWTPASFVARMGQLATRHHCESPLYPCLDHGGPWLKDAHARQGLSLDEAMAEVKASLTACLEAGYRLLHIDPTVDRTLPEGQVPPLDAVVERTVQLIAHAEAERGKRGWPPISFEVGTEEVHGGLADLSKFEQFLGDLARGLEAQGLAHAWPCFVVGKVGTDLHTTDFDPQTARRLYERVVPWGSLVKGHYTDWVDDPAAYPLAGMGGANVGPEFTATELAALKDLCRRETDVLGTTPRREPSGFEGRLREAVVASGRWKKWLLPAERGSSFEALGPERRDWLVATGARYVWTAPQVVAARAQLYDNLGGALPDPHGFVVDRIAANIQTYVDAFNLKDSLTPLAQE